MRTNWYQGYERSSGWQRRSMFDDLLENENALIYIIIALNVLIFIIWNTYGMNMLLMSFPFSILNTPGRNVARGSQNHGAALPCVAQQCACWSVP